MDATTDTEWVFNRPKHGWVCFHCGVTFRVPGAAEHHFGKRVTDKPLCVADQTDLCETRRERDKLRAALEAIKKATVDGLVCDDVAWFDTITTLYDFCDLALHGGVGDEQSTEAPHGS